MPASCTAYSCTHRRTVEKRRQGITFHRYPKDPELRKKWEVALKRKYFAAKEDSVICSNHFKAEDFDRTGVSNNNPTAGQFQAIFRRLMFRCGVKPVQSGNVTEQDATVSLSAVSLSSPDASPAEDLHSPFADISALVNDHSYLPSRFGGLVENALVYISGFVVRRMLCSLSCDVCRASLVTDAVHASFDESYHLLELRNNGGLIIPSEGTVKVVRAAERVIQRRPSGQAPNQLVVTHIIREEMGKKDIFSLGRHIEETQFGIDNHQSQLLSLIVSIFLKIRLHHIAKMTTLTWQSGSTRKKLCKTILFQGF